MKLRQTPATRQGWLDKLGKRLVWYFPSLQVREILRDYQEQFEAGEERGRTDAEMIQALGTPAEAAARLLEEEPTARFARLRTSGLWGIVLALCLEFLFVCTVNAVYTSPITWVGAYFFIVLGAAVTFMLLRGPVRVEMEERFPPERTASPVLVYGVPFAFTAMFEAAEQILVLLARPGGILAVDGIGYVNTWFILILELVMCLLLVWLLVRSVTASIRYFPGVIHTVGAMGTAFYSYAYYTSMELELPPPTIALLFCLIPYFLALATALAYQRWTDRRWPMPKLFLPVENTRGGWLHQLGHSLLGWFPAEQALEILEDYQEQFELGLERGKTEEALIVEMSRPEVVVRDLVREDWKAKRYHRKHLWWAVPLAVGAWLLLELAATFERGYGGLRWLLYGHNDGESWRLVVFALVLSAVSLFALLHGRGRAELEKQFPAAKKPAVWLWVLPLVLIIFMTAWTLRILQNPPEMWRSLVMGWPAFVVTVELSVFIMAALLVWTLARCGSGSIWYLPAAVHITGYIAQVLCYGIFLHGMDMMSYEVSKLAVKRFFSNLSVYGVSVALAVLFGLVIRSAGKKR